MDVLKLNKSEEGLLATCLSLEESMGGAAENSLIKGAAMALQSDMKMRRENARRQLRQIDSGKSRRQPTF